MKSKMKLLLMLLMFLCSVGASAQDVIVKKDGSTVVCRVLEVNASEIVYKKWTDLNGSNYVMNRADASAINYQSGKRENLGEMTNLYAPNNQNDGTQMLNDKALLAMDTATEKTPRQIKTMRIIGLIGGAVIIGIGGLVMLNAPSDIGYDEQMITGGVIMGCGVIGASALCIIAHNKQKQIDRLQISSIYQHKLKFKNGTALTPSFDLFKDQILNTQTIGMGLSYNF